MAVTSINALTCALTCEDLLPNDVSGGAIEVVPATSFRVILDVATPNVEMSTFAMSVGLLRYSVCFWPRGQNIGLVFEHTNKLEDEVCVRSVLTNKCPLERSKGFKEYLGERAGVRPGDVVRGMNYELFCGYSDNTSSDTGNVPIDIQDLYDIIESVPHCIVIHFERTVPSSRINHKHTAESDSNLPEETGGFFARYLNKLRKNPAPPALSSSLIGTSIGRQTDAAAVDDFHPYSKLFLSQDTISIERANSLERIIRHLKYHQVREWQRYMYKVVSNHTQKLKIKKDSHVSSDVIAKKRVCMHEVDVTVGCRQCLDSVVDSFYEPLELDCSKFIKEWDRTSSSPHVYYHQPLSYCPITNPQRPSAAHILRPVLCTRLVRTETRTSADESLEKVYYVNWVKDISSGAEWIVTKRYSAYVHFRKALMMIRPKVISRIPFPPKRILKVMDGVTVPERLALLQLFTITLQRMMSIHAHHSSTIQMRQIYEHFFEVPSHITRIRSLEADVKATPNVYLERQLQIFGHHIMNLQEMENVVENFLHKYHTDILQECSPSAALYVSSARAAGSDAILWNISNGVKPLMELGKFMEDLQCALESILLCGSADGTESSDFWTIIGSGVNVIEEGLAPFGGLHCHEHSTVELPGGGAAHVDPPPPAEGPTLPQGPQGTEGPTHPTNLNMYDDRGRTVSTSNGIGRAVSVSRARSVSGHIPLPLPPIANSERSCVPSIDLNKPPVTIGSASPPGSPRTRTRGSSLVLAHLSCPVNSRQSSKEPHAWRTIIAQSASTTKLNVYSTAATASSRLPPSDTMHNNHRTTPIASSGLSTVQSHCTMSSTMNEAVSSLEPCSTVDLKTEGVPVAFGEPSNIAHLGKNVELSASPRNSGTDRWPVLPPSSESLFADADRDGNGILSNSTSPTLDLKCSNLTSMANVSSTVSSGWCSPTILTDSLGTETSGEQETNAMMVTMTPPTNNKDIHLHPDSTKTDDHVNALASVVAVSPTTTSPCEDIKEHVNGSLKEDGAGGQDHQNQGHDASTDTTPGSLTDPLDLLLTYSKDLLNEDAVCQLGQTAIRQLIEIQLYIPVCARLRSYLNAYYFEQEKVLLSQLDKLAYKRQGFFGIPAKHRSPSHWKEAIVAMRKVKSFSLPYTKINAFFAAIQCIPTIYLKEHPEDAAAKDACFGADDFLPIFIYILVKARISHLLSLSMELQVLCDNDRKAAEAGYYLTTLDASLHHLMEMDIS